VQIAHTVDGPTSVDTPQLASAAATETAIASSASGSVTSTSGATAALMCTCSYTNATSAAVKVHVDYSARASQSVAGGGVGTSFVEYDYNIATVGGGSNQSSNLRQDGTEADYGYVREVSVPSGKTITADFYAGATRTSGTSVTANWRDVVVRIAAIKR
jgi:hypothetical protein